MMVESGLHQVGTVNGDKFEDVRSRAILLAYDYTVFAGTQGGANHCEISLHPARYQPFLWVLSYRRSLI